MGVTLAMIEKEFGERYFGFDSLKSRGLGLGHGFSTGAFAQPRGALGT